MCACVVALVCVLSCLPDAEAEMLVLVVVVAFGEVETVRFMRGAGGCKKTPNELQNIDTNKSNTHTYRFLLQASRHRNVAWEGRGADGNEFRRTASSRRGGQPRTMITRVRGTERDKERGIEGERTRVALLLLWHGLSAWE